MVKIKDKSVHLLTTASVSTSDLSRDLAAHHGNLNNCPLTAAQGKQWSYMRLVDLSIFRVIPADEVIV